MKRKFFLALFLCLAIAASFALAYKAVIETDDPKIASGFYFLLGKNSFENKDYGNAINHFKKAAELDPDFAEAFHNLGVSYHYNDDDENAVDSFEKAIEIDENYAKAHYSIALIYFEKRDFENAINHFEKLVQIWPENPNVHFDLAVAHVDRFREKESRGSIAKEDLEDLRKGIMHYLEAEELQDGFPNALSNARIVQFVLDDYEK